MNLLARQPDNTDPLLLLRRAEPTLSQTCWGSRFTVAETNLFLHLGDCCLRFVVDNETDTIMSQFQPSPFRAS